MLHKALGHGDAATGGRGEERMIILRVPVSFNPRVKRFTSNPPCLRVLESPCLAFAPTREAV